MVAHVTCDHTISSTTAAAGCRFQDVVQLPKVVKMHDFNS
jgi:hypothetical protein